MEDPQRPVRIGDVSRDIGLSPTRIRELADTGVIPSTRTEGGHRLFNLPAVRAAIARRTLTADQFPPASARQPDWRHELTIIGLAEDEVWKRVKADLGIPSDTRA